jgi:hypothetical protein
MSLVVVARGSTAHVKELADRCQDSGLDVAMQRCTGRS